MLLTQAGGDFVVKLSWPPSMSIAIGVARRQLTFAAAIVSGLHRASCVATGCKRFFYDFATGRRPRRHEKTPTRNRMVDRVWSYLVWLKRSELQMLTPTHHGPLCNMSNGVLTFG